MNLTVSYGDRHYRIRLDDIDDARSPQQREYMKYSIMKHMYRALIDYHGPRICQPGEVAELKRKLYELAVERPDVAQCMREKNILL